MATDHERITYDIDEPREVYNTIVYAGSIVTVNDAINTADVQIDNVGFVTNIPIFYHCPGETTTDSGYRGFRDGDRVILVSKNAVKESVTSDNTNVVGFEDGIARKCHPGFLFIMAGIENDEGSGYDTRMITVFDPVEDNIVNIPGVSFPCQWNDENFQNWLSSYQEKGMAGLVNYRYQQGNALDYARIINYQSCGIGDFCNRVAYLPVCPGPPLDCSQRESCKDFIENRLVKLYGYWVPNCCCTCSDNSPTLTEQEKGLYIGQDSFTFNYYSTYRCSENPSEEEPNVGWCEHQSEHSENYYTATIHELRWEPISAGYGMGQEQQDAKWISLLTDFKGIQHPCHMRLNINYEGSHDAEFDNVTKVSEAFYKSGTNTFTLVCPFGDLSPIVRRTSGEYGFTDDDNKYGGWVETGGSIYNTHLVCGIRTGGVGQFMFAAYYKANIDLTINYDYTEEITGKITLDFGSDIDIDVKAGFLISENDYTENEFSDIVQSENLSNAIKNNMKQYFSLSRSYGVLAGDRVGSDKYKPMYFKLYK